MNESVETKWEGWAILELMGHRRLAGYVTDVDMFGTAMCRIDVPNGDNSVTQFYGGSSIYCLTPTTEEAARAVAQRSQPKPVHQYELPATTQSTEEEYGDYEDDEEEVPLF